MSEEWQQIINLRDEQILRLVLYYGFIFPLSLIAGFFFLYNMAQKQRLKREEKKQKDLTNLEHRSNGKVKHEVND